MKKDEKTSTYYAKKIIPLCLAAAMVVLVGKYILQGVKSRELNKLYEYTSSSQSNQDVSIDDSGIDEISDKVHAIGHNMANGLIEADRIWGVVPMTKENVDKLYTIVSKVKLPDRDKLLRIIGKWRKGDFKEIVQQHNYFWYSLHGTVGEAYGKNEAAIEKAMRAMKE